MNPQAEGHFEAPRGSGAKRVGGGLLALLILVLGLARLGTEVFKLLAYADVFASGRRMLSYQDITGPDLKDLNLGDDQEHQVQQLEDGSSLVYQGHTYQLNRDLTTVLCLGVDNDIQESDTPGTSGLSDVVLLVGIDTKTGRTTVLNIPRETYGQVVIYSVEGNYVGTEFEQICMAYSYGNGRDTSGKNAMDTVSRLLYGLPISSFLAIDMDVLQTVNEAVGGVTVASMIEGKFPDGSQVKQGESIELHGKNLEYYIRTRSHSTLDANAARNLRQRQYLTELVRVMAARSRQDFRFPLTLFSALTKDMATDLELPDVTFLGRVFLNQGANFNYRTLGGTYGYIHNSPVLYPDETQLFEAMLELFYKRVD
ncbi:MAG: LCP family protein [Oscillospiraceae bacterium]|nr:LCP family protein [Oscillospiraceae bacterium]